MKAIWNDVVLAESAETIEVEGNHYFPANSLVSAYFRVSELQSVCPWKGEAHYYDIVVQEECNQAAAWYYPETLPKAAHFCGYVAFWKGVTVQ